MIEAGVLVGLAARRRRAARRADAARLGHACSPQSDDGPGGAARRGHVAGRHDRGRTARARGARRARRDPRRGQRGDAPFARARRRAERPMSEPREAARRGSSRASATSQRRAAARPPKSCSSGRTVAGAGGRARSDRAAPLVERIVAGDRRALGELAPIAGLTSTTRGRRSTEVVRRDAPTSPRIDPDRTLAADARARPRASSRSRRAGGRIALATARPASLLTVYLALARARPDRGRRRRRRADVGPAARRRPVAALAALGRRRRGRHRRPGAVRDPRRRGGAASGCSSSRGPRSSIADGPFADVAWEAGIEVDRARRPRPCSLAVAAARGGRCTRRPDVDRPAARRLPALLEDRWSTAARRPGARSGRRNARREV